MHPTRVLLATLLLALSCSNLSAESPVVSDDGRATFRVEAPHAKNVQVDIKGRTSDANEGKPYDMVKGDDGVWTYTSEPLDPGFHYYFLYLDGFRFADASSPLYFGWQRLSNGVEIPDPGFDLYEARRVPRGEIRALPYFSELTQEWREVLVYTPPDYSRDTQRRYPTLYLQHGSGENETSWSRQGRAGNILDNLIAEECCVPMIVVMERGYAYPPDAELDANGRKENQFAQLLLTETIPLIDSRYRTLANRQDRAIAGLSMGAGQALRIATENLERFAYLGLFSGGGRDLDEVIAKGAQINEALELFWIGCGTEDFLYDRVETMVKELGKAGIEHSFFTRPGTHEWQAWRLHLSVFAPLLFRSTN